jgi:hypothetical protein
MHIDLYCPHCRHHFTASAATPQAAVLDRMEEGPWSALGDGETFEDSVAAALADSRCPDCGSALTAPEESLNRLTMMLLAAW